MLEISKYLARSTVPRFNQMTAVAFTDILGFGLGFVGCGLGLEGIHFLGLEGCGLGLGGCGIGLGLEGHDLGLGLEGDGLGLGLRFGRCGLGLEGCGLVNTTADYINENLPGCFHPRLGRRV